MPSPFFVLSGFLITYLLLQEKAQTGKVQIVHFYIRRTLRIWPLYFTFLGIILLYNILAQQDLVWANVLCHVFFITNLVHGLSGMISGAPHLWSLCVEEQFYLMWPWSIKFVKRPIFFLVGFLVAFTALKVILRITLGGFAVPYSLMQITRFDCMAIGGIGAWWFANGISARAGKLLFSIPTQIVCWLALMAAAADRFHFSSMLAHTAVACVGLVTILNLVANPKPLFRLEHRMWKFLGGISFGIYIWHPLVESLNGMPVMRLSLPAAGKIIFLVVAVFAQTILVAYLSMRFLEGPFLKLKDRFSTQRSPAEQPLPSVQPIADTVK